MSNKNTDFNWMGSRIVLHKNSSPGSAPNPDTIVLITVVETKKVNGDFGTKDQIGLRATDKDGNDYFNNWEVFDDLSHSPRYCWYDGNELWYDITQGLMERIPFRPVFMDQFKDVLAYCEIHQTLGEVGHYKEFAAKDLYPNQGPNREFCFDCFTGKHAYDPFENKWLGWKPVKKG
jgi:hypothetical protein